MLDSGSNMELIQLVIGITVVICIKLFIFKFFYNRFRLAKLSPEELKFDKIRKFYSKLKKNKALNKNEILRHTKNLENRILVFQALKNHNKLNLFPNEFLKREKASESYLANWLNMNDEFDSIPDEIHFFETIDLDESTSFLIYKFKSFEPHLFANRDWMYGYVGYNKLDIDPYAIPEIIFSEFDNKIISADKIKKKALFK
ncbi:hypothetical protein [Cellulophaga lytica]|uniref:hypothetical protein n=1 Tax=Cellulophaga lytica TaxID=979 RepID=UPI0004F752C8|nr:hypothetical protein [Cellulophaga lytica]AIM60611.1 hypothetical protein IX49_08795 [Cellulophaga lytica]SNQ44833.1 conserved hypothetical protein [Cellulophaga lytica]